MARVDFSLQEFTDLVGLRIRETERWVSPVAPPIRSIVRLYRLMERARSGSDIRSVMEQANALLNYHGVENLGEGLEYVNTGETYDLTLAWDANRHAFILTSWGDWIQEWERQNEEDEDDTEREVEEAEAVTPLDSADRIGRLFDVAIMFYGSHPRDARAQWALTDGDTNLWIRVREGDWQIVPLEDLSRGDGSLSPPTDRDRGTGWQLDSQSKRNAMVELDRFLEEIA